MAISIIQLNDMKEYWFRKIFLSCEIFTKRWGETGSWLSDQEFKFRYLAHMHMVKITLIYCRCFAHWWRASSRILYLLLLGQVHWHWMIILCVQSKAITKTCSYIPNKPDPYDICFNALCVWKYVYLFNVLIITQVR